MQSEQQQMLALLPLAQAGDESAIGRIAVYCLDKYRYRIAKLYSLDPAISREDLEMTFFEAIIRAIPKLDHRGNPFYAAGQFGVWAVGSELRTIKAMLTRRGAQPQPVDGETDWLERLADRLEPDFREIVVSRHESTRLVRIIAKADLKPHVRKALQIIYEGKAGDPDELGFNKRLAAEMEVSPQRASQIMAEAEATVWVEEAGELRTVRQLGVDVMPWEDA